MVMDKKQDKSIISHVNRKVIERIAMTKMYVMSQKKALFVL